MIPWVPLLSYALLCVWAALLGWLPFRLLDRYSLVEEAASTHRTMERASGPGVPCADCGSANEEAYRYCQQCGRQLPPSG
jgi:hypothetical protein